MDWWWWATTLSPPCWDKRQPSQSQCSRVTEALGHKLPSAWEVFCRTVFWWVVRPYSGPYGLWDLTTGGKAGPDRVITCDTGPMAEVEWIQDHPKAEDLRVGLISWAGTYLTFEAYKSNVTASGKTLSRRQTWELLVSNEHEAQAVVRLKSLRGYYVLCEADGTVCCGRPKTSHHGCFLLRFHRNCKWTLQCVISGRYLECDGEDVFCNSRVLSAYHMWTPRPALHIHVILYSPTYHSYARADHTVGRIWVDAPVPCLEECGFLLHFQDGCYHLETSTHHFLSRVDRLVSQRSAQTAFQLQVRPRGLVALCDGEGGTLYPQGTHLLLSLGSNPMRGEEWFVLQHFPTWVSLKSRSRKFLSIGYDAEVCAASECLTPMSLFQYECDRESSTLQLRSANGYYLTQRRHKVVRADGHPMECDSFFRVHWNCGRIILQSSNGRFLGIASNGLLMSIAVIPGPNEQLGIRFANRPFLILRGRYGYVGSSSERDLVQCNLEEPDCIQILPCHHSIYHFQAQGGSFWSITSFGTFRPWGKFALNFCIELQGSNLLTVLAPNGFYIRADRSGTLLADSADITKECIWEF